MTHFKFTRISRQLIGELTETVKDGESAVLLGPRFSAKRFVMQEVLSGLDKSPGAIGLQVRNIGSSALTTIAELGQRLTSAVRALGYEPPEAAEEDVFSAVDWLHRTTGHCVHLLAADVDGMAHHVARIFLQGVRARVADRRMVALLSGEFHFRDLVHGPDSEFNPALQFFFQGLDEELFAEFFQSYTGGLGVRIDQAGALRERLFELTGGSSYLMRTLLESAREQHARSSAAKKTIGVEDFTGHLEWDTRPIAHWSNVLHYPTRVISCAPECWTGLEALLANRIVEGSFPGTPPGALEFSGLVRRDLERRRLVWASPFLEGLARRYYDPRRLGDLYAQNGEWKEAFERYSRLPAEERIRPVDFEDKLKAEHAVNSLSAALHSEVDRGPDHLRKRFADGARLLLGFPDISNWVLDGSWSPTGKEPASAGASEVAQALPVRETLTAGWIPLPERFSTYAAAAILPTSRPGRYHAILVGDFDTQRAISRERDRLLRKLVSHYVAADGRADAIETAQRRLKTRDSYRVIIDSISDALGRNALDIRQVLRLAAQGLRKLGYYRVEFCFVDWAQQRIKGIVDLNEGPDHVNVADMTDWPLVPATADIQTYVASTGKPRIVSDPLREPLINPAVLQAVRLRPLAVVPILSREQTVLGTIHVERNDSLVPIEEEVQDLLFFGRQIAAVIEQSERVRLLHDALDKIPSPVSLVGPDCEALYANRPASELFDVRPGWRATTDDPQASAQWGDRLTADLEQCLKGGQRAVHHYAGIGVRRDYRGTASCSKIQNWLGATVATVLHVQDLNYLEEVLEAFGLVAQSSDTDSACRNLLKVCLKLGARWARLYLVDPRDPKRLVGRLWLGDGAEQAGADFCDRICFQRGVDPEFGWLAMEIGEPKLFCYNPLGSEGHLLKTPQGLDLVTVTAPPSCPPKAPGEKWIDLPLVTPDGKLGKVTLDCEPWLVPEKFETLKVLSSIAAALLGAFTHMDRMLLDREAYIMRSVAETVLASIAHSLNTRLAALPGILTLYKAAENQPALLPELNCDFQHVLENALGTVARAKEMLAAITLYPRPFDLYEYFDTTLRSAQLQEVCKVAGDGESLEVEWDSHHIGSVLLELICNSQQAADKASVDLRISTFEKEGEEWVRLVCSDQGQGIPVDLKEVIFNDFFTRQSQRHGGTGLGLWYVRRVALAHGGSVKETGTPGLGARFEFELPRRVPNRK